MKEKHISSKELSLRSGVSSTWISYLLNGKRSPTDTVVGKLAESLEVSEDYLTGEAASVIINERLEERGITLEEVAKETGVSLHWLQNLDYFTPGNEFDYEWITRVAKAIGLPGSKLRTALARQEPPVYENASESVSDLPIKYYYDEYNSEPFKREEKAVFIPILEFIRPDKPLFAEENVIGTAPISNREYNWGPGGYFFLMAQGDSMVGSRIHEGDLLLIHRQSSVDNGEIAVIVINKEEVAVGRVYYDYDNKLMTVRPDSPKYEPRTFTFKQMAEMPITTIGKVVEVRFRT
jgi:SOS-response transcriptional repressor LexA